VIDNNDARWKPEISRYVVYTVLLQRINVQVCFTSIQIYGLSVNCTFKRVFASSKTQLEPLSG
jgi:hypothetical protein